MILKLVLWNPDRNAELHKYHACKENWIFFSVHADLFQVIAEIK